MPCRVVAFFLAFVLFWTGLSTIEAPSALAQPSAEQQRALAQAGGPGPSSLHDGSVEDHHLDDLPSQAQSDHSADTPGMLPSLLKPASEPLARAQPHTFASAAAGSPFLAGPLRPPCSEALAG